MEINVTPFDAAEYLERESSQHNLLKDALASRNPRYLATALGAIARAKGLSKLERETGIKRQTLNKSLSEKGNPTLETLWTVVDAIGYELDFRPKSEAQPTTIPV